MITDSLCAAAGGLSIRQPSSSSVAQDNTNTNSFDSDLATAIENSLQEEGGRPAAEMAEEFIPRSEDAVEILRCHVGKLFGEETPNSPTTKVLVCRDNTFRTFVSVLLTGKLKETSRINVKFFDALHTVDDGGPTREFLLRLIRDVTENVGVFEDTEDKGSTITHNAELLAANSYYHAGYAFAMALVYGGPSLNILNEVTYEFLTGCTNPREPVLADLSDQAAAKILKMLEEAQSQERIDYIISGFGENDGDAALFMIRRPEDMFHDAGMSSIVTLANKTKRIQMVKQHLTIGRVRSELEQFREGLQSYGVMELLKRHADCFRVLFVHGMGHSGLAVDELVEMFLPQFSDNGTSRRRVENAVMAHWVTFVASLPTDRVEKEEDPLRPLVVADILEWATGARSVPHLGWGHGRTPSLEFQHREAGSSALPESRTCGPTIILPINGLVSPTYARFQEIMEMSIKGSLPGIYLT